MLYSLSFTQKQEKKNVYVNISSNHRKKTHTHTRAHNGIDLDQTEGKQVIIYLNITT